VGVCVCARARACVRVMLLGIYNCARSSTVELFSKLLAFICHLLVCISVEITGCLRWKHISLYPRPIPTLCVFVCVRACVRACVPIVLFDGYECNG